MQPRLGDLLATANSRNPAGGVIATDMRLHTWQELDQDASQIARCLVAHGVQKGDRVAVLHPKSVRSFVAVHAIVRCGAVMVPLDPMGPPDAVESVLDFCTPTAVIGNAKTLKTRALTYVEHHRPHLILSGSDAEIEALGVHSDLVTPYDEACSDQSAPLPRVEPDDLAYIIFTSGSTGEPKGISHTHRSAMAYVKNACAAHRLEISDRVAGTSPLHFDMSTLELYATPYAGATAVTITEPELRFPASLSKRFQDTGVTVLYAVPYQLRQLCLRGDVANKDLSTLRQISFGGEQFAPGVLHELSETLPAAELLNVYGPAEVNGIVSYRWPPRPSRITEVPIGTKWPDVDLRIVDEELDAVEPGEPGELLAASSSQMVGYWERPDLNQLCFVEIDGKRWYRTGDVVRADGDGQLHFLGRADTRVKVRGVRLELETIESVLSDAPGIDSAVVGVSEAETGVQQVVAWVLPQHGTRPEAGELRRWCATRLTDAAVPSDIRFVEAFAQSRTGKIDRKALRVTLGRQQPPKKDQC